ncbi:MAG TPA: isoaspartyl peptidase/L-asparaginase [Flavobacteriaceae bacterium]|nr:isoaspartyl peptidase/L-asparaginase [Flavobacteriaceae bacterium]
MKKAIYLFFTVALFYACHEKVESVVEENPQIKALVPQAQANKFGIVIHGGAGSIEEKGMSDSTKVAYEKKLEEAIRTGYAILENGGTAVDAVRETIKIMENSPLFNSGKGAVFANDETNQLDASIMNGKTLEAGAVAGVTKVKNPIALAYEVMVNSPHVLLYGEGAEEFAKKQGIELVDPSYFRTEKSYNALQRVKAAEKKKKANNKTAFYNEFIHNSKYGTVGCVALDKNGNLAAGTSTGGMTNKRWNRIGDSPLIGAGTYANNKTCAISCTGWGEYFIRGVAAYDVSALMEYGGKTLKEAAKTVIHEKLPSEGGGGLIGIDAKGNMVAGFNTPGMFRATMNDQGKLEIAMFGAN